MTSDGKFSARHNLPVPGDGQDEPLDDQTQARNISDADAENWADILQTILLDDSFVDGRLVGSGTLASRGAAGTDAPKLWVVTDGGDSSDQPYLTFNDDSNWFRAGYIVERASIVAGDSPYDTTTGEMVWADASSGAITVNLPSPSDNTTIPVVVTDATNDVTISRNGTENIDGSASDLTITTERTVVLVSDGTNWRTVQDTREREPFSYAPGMTEWADGLSNEEVDRIALQTGETLVVERIEFRQKGGGSSASASIDVRDTGAASTIGSQDLGGTTKDPGSSNAGNTVIVRVSNSTGSSIDAAPRVTGWIEGA